MPPIARQGLPDSLWTRKPLLASHESSDTKPSHLPTRGRVLSSAFSAERLPERLRQRILSWSQVPAHAHLQHWQSSGLTQPRTELEGLLGW